MDRCLRWLMPSVGRDLQAIRGEIHQVRQLRYEAALALAHSQRNGKMPHRQPKIFTPADRQGVGDMA